jgi:hypothetical protein
VTIRETLAHEHEGHPTDYIAFKSVLSPFTLICPNPRTRDKIVTRGVYNITSVIIVTSVIRVPLLTLALTITTQPAIDPLSTLTEITLHTISLLSPKLNPFMHRSRPLTAPMALLDIEPHLHNTQTTEPNQMDNNKSCDLSPAPLRRSSRLKGKLAQFTPARIDNFLRGSKNKATVGRKAKKCPYRSSFMSRSTSS